MIQNSIIPIIHFMSSFLIALYSKNNSNDFLFSEICFRLHNKNF